MKKLILTAISLVALGAVACKKTIDDTPFLNQSVAVILRSETDTVGLQIAKGIIGASMQYSILPDLFFADSLTDYQGQIDIIEELDPTQYIGFIIIPAADNAQMRSIITQVNQITPVVLAHAELSGDLPILSFVGSDNIAAGETLAAQVNKTLSTGDTICIIQTNKESNVAARLFGLSQRAEQLGHPTYTTSLDGLSDVGNVTKELLQLYPNAKAIITGDPHSSVIVAATLQELNDVDVKVFTFGIPNSVATQIKIGNIEGTMAGDTYHIGYYSVMAIVDYSLNITPWRTQYQSSMYIDKDNIASKEALIYINKI